MLGSLLQSVPDLEGTGYDQSAVDALLAGAALPTFEASEDASVATQICDELDRHATGEEKAVYPAIASDVPGGEQMAKEGVEEHKEARQLIGRIRQTSDPNHLAELVEELKEAIQHHVQEEESEILPKTRKALAPERLEQLVLLLGLDAFRDDVDAEAAAEVDDGADDLHVFRLMECVADE